MSNRRNRPSDHRTAAALRADTLQLHQHGRRRGRLVRRRLEQGVPFRRDGLQLRQHDLEPIQLADDLRLQVHRQGPTVTGPQVLQPLTPMLAQRLVAETPWAKSSPLIRLTCLTRSPISVRRSRQTRRRSSSCGVGALAIEHTRGSPRLKAIRVRTRVSPSIRSVFARRRSARGQDRGGVDHVALDPFGLQHPVDPEAVQAGLLDDNDREVPAGPRRSFAPEFARTDAADQAHRSPEPSVWTSSPQPQAIGT